jgi:Domain of unknown function (DUF5668)
MKRVFDGLSLIAVGAVLLACTTGYLSWAVWISIFSLWPVLLISAGIDIIGKSSDREWLRALSSVVFVCALLYGAFVMPAGTWGMPWSTGGAGEAFSQSEVAGAGVTEGTAKIEAGATILTLKGGSGLVSISGEAPAGAKPTVASTTDGSKSVVSVSQPRETVVWVGVSPRRRLDVALDRTLRWTALDVNAGATQGDLDLSDLKVERLSLNAGASDTRITFGVSGAVADISAGAANITLRVPKSAKVSIRLSGALTSANLPSDFHRDSGNGFIGDTVWTVDPDAGRSLALIDAAVLPIDITVHAGVASINVQRY